MVKEKPLKAATKKKQPSKPVKKQVSAKKKNKKKELKEMPVWCRYLLGCLIVVAFTSVFYFFFIRPYAYRWKPCYGLKGYGVCMPAGYKVHGIDISHYQGKINWEMLKQTRQGQFPIQFIFMKATEGGDYSDKKFVANFDMGYSEADGFNRYAASAVSNENAEFVTPKSSSECIVDFISWQRCFPCGRENPI